MQEALSGPADTASFLAEKYYRWVKLTSKQRHIYLHSCGYFCVKFTFASLKPLSLLSHVFSLFYVNFYDFQSIDLKAVEVGAHLDALHAWLSNLVVTSYKLKMMF